MAESNVSSQWDSISYLQDYMGLVAQTLQELPWQTMRRLVDLLHQARLCRVNVFIAGNGGSAATASHFVNNLNKGAQAPGMPRFRAIGLMDSVPLPVDWRNDAGCAEGSLEPLANLIRPGDLIIGISCSGNSTNVVQAMTFAQRVGATTVAVTGSPGGQLAAMADLSLIVPNGCAEQVEDAHRVLEHALVSALRQKALSSREPSLQLANGRGATPETPAVEPELPRRPAILIDRDGVINQNRPDYVKNWQEFELLPGALNALRELSNAGLPIVVVTNQSGVNRGVMRYEMAESINSRLMAVAARSGGRIDAVCWCPHAPDEDCLCRKPRPGMLQYAAASLGLDLDRSYLIGDAVTDIEAGVRAGCSTVLVLTGRGAAHRARVDECYADNCHVSSDLSEAVAWLLSDLHNRSVHG